MVLLVYFFKCLAFEYIFTTVIVCIPRCLCNSSNFSNKNGEQVSSHRPHNTFSDMDRLLLVRVFVCFKQLSLKWKHPSG